MKTLASYAVLLGVVSLPLWAPPFVDSDPTPHVTESTLREALNSSVPSRLPGTDELEFFRHRKAGSPDDVLADRRIAATHLQRFQAYGRADDLDLAEAVIDSLIARRPAQANLWSTRAQIHLSRHEFSQAHSAALRAVGAASPEEQQHLRFRLFDVLFAMGRYDEAERVLDLPNDRKAFAYLVRDARLRDRKGDVEGARDLMRKALRLAEAYAQPAMTLAWNHVELGHFEYHSGDPDGAVGHYREALRIVPGYPAALEGLGWIAYGTDEDPDRAHDLFTKALHNGGHDDLHLTLADLALHAGQAEDAYQEIESLADRASTNDALRRLVAEPLSTALSEIDPERALPFSAANLAERRTAEALAIHGWVLHRLGRRDEAGALFDDAVRWGVPQPMVFYLAGRHAAETGKRRKAMEWLSLARKGGAELGPRRAREVAALLREL